MSAPYAPTVAIVGGGASGVLAALHLVDRPGAARPRVVLVERSGKLGGGPAFSTASTSHLLNIPACSMSAFDHDPSHFVRWLHRNGRPGAGGSFVPRNLFGQYLRETLWSSVRGRQGDVQVVHDQVVAITTPAGVPALIFERQQPIRVQAAILATGVVPPRWPEALAELTSHDRCVRDPWAPGALALVEPSATVTLLGTGLTAIDALLTLADKRHRGAVHAISRHGLVPAAHVAAGEGELAERVKGLTGTSTRALLRGFREILAGSPDRGASWREALDALRPMAPGLWQQLSEEEQCRFKRHLERLWSVHRHRMAPEVADRVESLRDEGIFHVHSGEVVSLSASGPALRLGVKLRRSGAQHSWPTDWLVNCTGPDAFVFGEDQVLMNALHREGLAHPGRLGMGVATSTTGQVLASNDRPVPWLWAVGSLRQGQLFESNAVPEIRSQANEVAAAVQRMLAALHTAQAS